MYDTDEVFLVWENEYDKGAGICDFLLTFFFPKSPNGSYRREEECVSERAYTKERLRGMVEREQPGWSFWRCMGTARRGRPPTRSREFTL